MANIVVYGSGWAGIAAAEKAAHNAPGDMVHLISPYPVAKLGGISTIGGQNYVDKREWNGRYPQGGSFRDWFGTSGAQFYNTEEKAAYFRSYLRRRSSNVTIHDCCDITAFTTATNPFRITSLTLRPITRNSSTQYIEWTGTPWTLACDMVIDASDDAKIARNVNPAVTTGRYDWPSQYLDADERANGVAKQQAATLMFKMKDIVYDATATNLDENGKPYMSYDNPASNFNMCWGGNQAYSKVTATDDPESIYAFNETFKDLGYMLKPVNVARNGTGSNEFWVNSLLVFNVDGRIHNRDTAIGLSPSTFLSNVYSTDQAYARTVSFLNNNAARILAALKTFPGFSGADFVRDANGKIVVGETLYIRETVHMAAWSANIANGTENTNYYLTTNECHGAGSSSAMGDDLDNYSSRIGLGYYYSDLHPYSPDDLKVGSNYIWAPDAYGVLRNDYSFDGNTPYCPVYIPYRVLVTNYVANLLLPGYAANMSSFAWGEMRVFPNQAVLGDAAGVTAAYCIENGVYPCDVTSAQLATIQNMLRSEGSILEK